MARVESVQLVDDLDGGVADETVSFSLEGSGFEIDLTAAHASELRDALAPFVGAARRPSPESSGQASPSRTTAGRATAGGAAPGASATARRETAEIRQWALANGFDLSERGRIPNAVVEAYDNRTASETPAAETPAAETPAAEAPAAERVDDAPASAREKQGTSGPVDVSGLFKEASPA